MDRWRSAVALVGALALTACGGDRDGDQVDDSPLITLTEKANSWPAAEIRGVLSEREGCLLIGASVAVFPFGTKWQPPEVVFGDRSSVTVGDDVSLGGGVFDAVNSAADDLPTVPVDRVQACAKRAGVTTFVWAAP